jgi:hypothetical protein
MPPEPPFSPQGPKVIQDARRALIDLPVELNRRPRPRSSRHRREPRDRDDEADPADLVAAENTVVAWANQDGVAPSLTAADENTAHPPPRS